MNHHEVLLNLSARAIGGDFLGEVIRCMLVSLKLTLREGIVKSEEGLCSLVIAP